MAETKKKTVKAASASAEKKAVAPKAKAKKAEAKVASKTEVTEAKPAVKAEPVKEEKKPVEAKAEKPAVTEAHAFARDVRVTPRKVRLVVDLVRGKDVDDALAILARVNRAASAPVIKVIQSAAANATNNFGMSKEALYISNIQASDGVRMKRFEPRGKGGSSPLIKRMANIAVTVKERK